MAEAQNRDLTGRAGIEVALEERAAAHEQLLGALSQPRSAEAINAIAEAMSRFLNEGRSLFFFGNGESSADAQHAAAEFVGRFRSERRPLSAIALGTNPAVSSALANDYGFAEEGLARELEALGRPGHLAIAISNSGRSPGVLAALGRAGELGMRRVALTGSGHELGGLADRLVEVESTNVTLIQEMHEVVLHILCAAVEDRLGVT